MSLTVMLSAMYLKDWTYIRKLRITGNAVVINQCCREEAETVREKDRFIRFISTEERGLSRSRNMALRTVFSGFETPIPKEETGIFCDNDVCYRKGYEEIIEKAFRRHPESDILVFFIRRPERQKPVMGRERRMGYLSTMKIFSPEVAFRLESIRKAGLFMDTDFGAGAKYSMGEENIFLFDALRAGLRITYIPIRIASLLPGESTWFRGYTAEFFRNRGAGYYRMSRRFAWLLALQYGVRKYRFYRKEQTFFQAMAGMAEGKREYAATCHLSNRR